MVMVDRDVVPAQRKPPRYPCADPLGRSGDEDSHL